MTALHTNVEVTMKCPVCTDVDLLMSERQGVEIDFCPTCRGVWLDRGELDKILERSAVELGGRGQERDRGGEPRHDARRHEEKHAHHDEHRHDDKHSHGAKKKKPTSFLSDIFEGFGE